MYDVIIVGGGPAGMTAGIYLARAGLKTLILEKETIGGQIALAAKVENYPGYLSISGAELSSNMYDQVVNAGADFEFENVINIENSEIKKVITEENKYEAKAVIIATGSKYRKLGLDTETKFIGNGVHFCTSCDGSFYRNKTVAIIGGANSALCNAIYLADIVSKLYLIYRGNELKGEKVIADSLIAKPNVEILFNTVVEKINGDDSVESIDIKKDGKKENLAVNGIFVSIGMDAQTELVDSLLKKNEYNYIVSDDCKTNLEGIFVAGDCRAKDLRQITTAVSDGAIAASLVIKYINNKKNN